MRDLHRNSRLLNNGIVYFLFTYFSNSIDSLWYLFNVSSEVSFKLFPNIDKFILFISNLDFKNYCAPFRYSFDGSLMTFNYLFFLNSPKFLSTLSWIINTSLAKGALILFFVFSNEKNSTPDIYVCSIFL